MFGGAGAFLRMEIGAAIEEAVPGIEVTTHIEPIEEPLAWNDARWQDEREEVGARGVVERQ
jgi:hypothetical protein